MLVCLLADVDAALFVVAAWAAVVLGAIGRDQLVVDGRSMMWQDRPGGAGPEPGWRYPLSSVT